MPGHWDLRNGSCRPIGEIRYVWIFCFFLLCACVFVFLKINFVFITVWWITMFNHAYAKVSGTGAKFYFLLCHGTAPCLRKKTVQISFCQNFVKFPLILVIFGRNMAKRLKLCEVHSISTSRNSYHPVRVLNKRSCSKLLRNAESC